MMEHDETVLSLKWNNHQSTFFNVLSNLRKKEVYTDATIACEGQFFSVHKLVISTCSDYFHEVFSKTSCKSPVVILKDISTKDLEYLLNYIYVGEIKVEQHELPSLIRAAQCLQIKGLAIADTNLSNIQVENASQDLKEMPPKKKLKRHKLKPSGKSSGTNAKEQNHSGVGDLGSLSSMHASEIIDDQSDDPLHIDETSPQVNSLNKREDTMHGDDLSSDYEEEQARAVQIIENQLAENFLEVVQDEGAIQCVAIEERAPWPDASPSSSLVANIAEHDTKDVNMSFVTGFANANVTPGTKEHRPIVGTSRRRCVPCGRIGKEKRTKIMCIACGVPYCGKCFVPSHSDP